MDTKNRYRKTMKENRIPTRKKKEYIEKNVETKRNEEVVVDHVVSKTLTLKTSKIPKKINKTNECNPLKLININVEPTDTLLKIDEMKLVVPETVPSPFVCTSGQKWKPSPRKLPKIPELYDKYEENTIADNYRKSLDTKTIELQNKVKYWTELSSGNGSGVPQSVRDEIDVACGQTKLLTTDKFMQMHTLINEYVNKSGQMLITTDDLDGFRDMLFLQVKKLESQFSQLAILEKNNWAPLKPFAKKAINRLPTVNKRPVVKSKHVDFIKNQVLKEKKATPNSENSDVKNDSNNSKFNEMKLQSNNTHFTSSTSTSSNQKNKSFTPILLKTMELSYVARRSGMASIVLTKPHISPLKPALQNPENEKGTKHQKIQFEFPENSSNDEINHKTIKNRVVTPHTLKTSKVITSQNHPISSSTTNHTGDEINLKRTVKVQTEKKETVNKTSVNVQDGKSSVRHSSRLANKPSKNYKC